MQEIIKLKLIGLGYNKRDYNIIKKMDWLDEKNDITFISIPKLIESKIFTQFNYKFVIPALINYEDYLKVEKYYGGLPIALEEYYYDYLKWLRSMDISNFIYQNNIRLALYQNYWYIYPYNYRTIKKIGIKLIKKLNKKLIKIKIKIKIN